LSVKKIIKSIAFMSSNIQPTTIKKFLEDNSLKTRFVLVYQQPVSILFI